jgi:dTDP-4-dehydrorhamnose 3,5-epimerase-like enzyme
MYILSGRLNCVSHDPKTDEAVEEKVLCANDLVYIPSMEIHGMKNLSDTEMATFLCCIANVDEDDSM